ncbi:MULTISPECIES: hypothetical protein [unclassified Bartonella]|uniref:hypothetical protein n=1 Tax=unclassified Bartonella TaxID=2645622 RepID=UPI0021C6D55C|nr:MULTISPECIES: hypothetical protein [unclassified Bartonella]UXN02473.1 hypothetical protein N6B01_08240 [Bartonella sp. HY406]UXN05446.1 hypothetical protein N6A79_09015 [Bartonella sp. HY761]
MNDSYAKRMSILSLSIFATALTLGFAIHYAKMPAYAAPLYQNSQNMNGNNS